jgi:hypothetical protein
VGRRRGGGALCGGLRCRWVARRKLSSHKPLRNREQNQKKGKRRGGSSVGSAGT